MTKQNDSDKLTQATLNRKYMELEEKDKEIEKLTRELNVLRMRHEEDKETISFLCKQISSLLLKQKKDA